MPLNERDELKLYSLLTKPYFQLPKTLVPPTPLHLYLYTQLSTYKSHLTAMAHS
jgi:hypothetical protein